MASASVMLLRYNVRFVEWNLESLDHRLLTGSPRSSVAPELSCAMHGRAGLMVTRLQKIRELDTIC